MGAALHFNSTHAFTYCSHWYHHYRQHVCQLFHSGLVPLNISSLQLGNPQHSSPLITSHHPGPLIFIPFFLALKLIKAWVFLEIHCNARFVSLSCYPMMHVQQQMHGSNRCYFDYLMLLWHCRTTWLNQFPRGRPWSIIVHVTFALQIGELNTNRVHPCSLSEWM